VAWGALSFGAVYPWAYQPLAVTAAVTGITSLLIGPRTVRVSMASVAVLVSIAIATALQLVPLPLHILRELTPATADALSQLHPGFALDSSQWHAISINPSATWRGLALFAGFALLLLGTSRLFSAITPAGTITGLTGIGAVLSFIGLVQAALYNGKIYGFWVTEQGGEPFGPFVNKNHFAGWMLMAVPLTLGLVCARVSRAMARIKPAPRDRLMWFSSMEANQIVLLLFAAGLMAIALVLTMSRSGMVALFVAISLTGWFVLRGRATATRKLLIVIYLSFLVAGTAVIVGADRIAARFSETDRKEFVIRRGAWADAWAIATMFPLTGTGLNTYGTASLLFQRHNLTHHFSTAHNDYLQLAAEGGVLLVLPAMLFIGVLTRDSVRRLKEAEASSSYWIRAGALTSIVAVGLQEMVDFSLQIPGNSVLFAVVCAIAIHRTERQPRQRT
jgi:O-antigen ligase